MVKTRAVCTYKYDNETGRLRDEDGYYVRWVACGYSQVFGKDFWQGYMATTKAAGVRLFAAQVQRFGLESRHVDVKKFFTQNKLHEKVYCEQMEGFEEGGKDPATGNAGTPSLHSPKRV